MDEGRKTSDGWKALYDLYIDPACLTSDLQDKSSTRKILVLNSAREAVDFHMTYAGPIDRLDWSKVKADFAGIELRFTPPTMYTMLDTMVDAGHIREDDFEKWSDLLPRAGWAMDWLVGGFDIASGVIWTPRHVLVGMKRLPDLEKLLHIGSKKKTGTRTGTRRL
jgi:hypothetical protein